ncbi:MAG: DegQ family serine endoprotease [Pseudomonadota bacterium]
MTVFASKTARLWAAMLIFVPAVIGSHKAYAQKQVPLSRQAMQMSFAPLVKRIAPSVVNVYAGRMNRQRRSPFAGDPFFERFFGGDRRRQRRQSNSLGSGVIIGADGLVITNHHVIKNADQIKVAMNDGREYEAEIVLVDKQSDLAVLRFNPQEDLKVVPLGDSEDLEVGDLVLAIGNPFGVGQTVTSGIVSALARSQRGIKDFGFFIQTDAAINPGNSGGALVSMDGELIGINTAIFSRSGGSNGIGFAVPSNMVRVVLQSVRKGSDSLLRPWVGATFQKVTPEIAESLGMNRPRGALVSRVEPGGPADQAGLRAGDVILQLDGKRVPHVNGLGYRLATAGIGRTVQISVRSRNRRKKLDLALAEPPENPPRDMRDLRGRAPFSGARVVNLSPRVAQELSLRGSPTGVMVLDVDPGSAAARFGLRPRDIIVEVNGRPVDTTRRLDRIVRRGSDFWDYIVQRGDRRFRRRVR